MKLFSFFKNRKGASDWSSIYLLIVVIIGVVLLVTLVKPALKAAGQSAVTGGQEAKTIAGIGSFVFTKIKHR